MTKRFFVSALMLLFVAGLADAQSAGGKGPMAPNSAAEGGAPLNLPRSGNGVEAALPQYSYIEADDPVRTIYAGNFNTSTGFPICGGLTTTSSSTNTWRVLHDVAFTPGGSTIYSSVPVGAQGSVVEVTWNGQVEVQQRGNTGLVVMRCTIGQGAGCGSGAAWANCVDTTPCANSAPQQGLWRQQDENGIINYGAPYPGGTTFGNLLLVSYHGWGVVNPGVPTTVRFEAAKFIGAGAPATDFAQICYSNMFVRFDPLAEGTRK